MRTIGEYHRIHIVLDGEDYGTRSWTNVPRKGEKIMLKRRRDDMTFFVATIKEVTWGVAVNDLVTKWPDINLHVTEKK